jgi:hypothetical protein
MFSRAMWHEMIIAGSFYTHEMLTFNTRFRIRAVHGKNSTTRVSHNVKGLTKSILIANIQKRN